MPKCVAVAAVDASQVVKHLVPPTLKITNARFTWPQRSRPPTKRSAYPLTGDTRSRGIRPATNIVVTCQEQGRSHLYESALSGAQPGSDGLLDGGHAAGSRQGSDRLRRVNRTRPPGHYGAVPAGWLRWRCAGGHGAPMVKSAPSVWSPNARPRMAKDGVVHRAVESLRIEFRSGVVGGWSPR